MEEYITIDCSKNNFCGNCKWWRKKLKYPSQSAICDVLHYNEKEQFYCIRKNCQGICSKTNETKNAEEICDSKDYNIRVIESFAQRPDATDFQIELGENNLFKRININIDNRCALCKYWYITDEADKDYQPHLIPEFPEKGLWFAAINRTGICVLCDKTHSCEDVCSKFDNRYLPPYEFVGRDTSVLENCFDNSKIYVPIKNKSIRNLVCKNLIKDLFILDYFYKQPNNTWFISEIKSRSDEFTYKYIASVLSLKKDETEYLFFKENIPRDANIKDSIIDKASDYFRIDRQFLIGFSTDCGNFRRYAHAKFRRIDRNIKNNATSKSSELTDRIITNTYYDYDFVFLLSLCFKFLSSDELKLLRRKIRCVLKKIKDERVIKKTTDSSNATETLGKRIKELRISKSLSLEMLAKQIGISKQALSKIENNITVPSVSNVENLAYELRCSKKYLIEGVEDVKQYEEGTNQYLEEKEEYEKGIVEEKPKNTAIYINPFLHTSYEQDGVTNFLLDMVGRDDKFLESALDLYETKKSNMKPYYEYVADLLLHPAKKNKIKFYNLEKEIEKYRPMR